MRLPSRFASVLLAATLGLAPAIAAAEPVIGVGSGQMFRPGGGGPGPRGGGGPGPRGGPGPGYHRPPPGGGPGFHRPPPRGHYRDRGWRDDGWDSGAAAAGLFGLAIGAMVGAEAARSSDDGHVARCMRRYRSYDPDSDTYRGYDGRLHRCRL